LAEVGEAEEVEEVAGGIRGWIEQVQGLEGGGGGGGEEEVGLEAEGGLEGLEGGEEMGSAQPAAEDGGSWPVAGIWAGGVLAEGT
jgi:hypothetical protein